MPRSTRDSASTPDRLAALERSLARTRLALLACALLLAVLVTTAWTSRQSLETDRLVLTAEDGTPVIVLKGSDDGSTPALVLESPEGAPILKLGPRVHGVR